MIRDGVSVEVNVDVDADLEKDIDVKGSVEDSGRCWRCS